MTTPIGEHRGPAGAAVAGAALGGLLGGLVTLPLAATGAAVSPFVGYPPYGYGYGWAPGPYFNPWPRSRWGRVRNPFHGHRGRHWY